MIVSGVIVSRMVMSRVIVMRRRRGCCGCVCRACGAVFGLQRLYGLIGRVGDLGRECRLVARGGSDRSWCIARYRVVVVTGVQLLGRCCVRMNVFSMVVLAKRNVVAAVVNMRLRRKAEINKAWINKSRIDLDHGALDALATAPAARIAMPGLATARAVVGFFLGLAMRTLVGFDQGLTISNRDLVVIRVDFAESEKAMAIAAIFNEGCLKRRFDPCDLGEVDIAAQLLALGGLEVEFFNAVAAYYNDPGFFRVGRIDEHFVGHGSTHGGRGRATRQARNAQPGDATVHLIRG